MERLGEGSVVAGRYRLVEPVSARDPGGVWRAVDRLTGGQVAVKLLAGHPADDAAARLRFRLVGRAALHLSDPGMARVHDFGEAVLPDGLAVPYLIRELVGGQTLDERLAQGPLPASEALSIVAAAASTLAAAHRSGMAHGHLVPANIVLTRDQVMLTDFGLAPMGRRRGAAELAGVLSYTAPELADGGPATPAADMYALGVVFTACLSGIGSPDVTPVPIPDSPIPDSPISDRTMSDSTISDSPIPDSAVPPDAAHVGAVPPGLAALWAACLGPSPAERPTAAHAAVMSRQVLPRRPAAPAPAAPAPADPALAPAAPVPARPAPADAATTPARPVPTVTPDPVLPPAPEPVPHRAPELAPARHPANATGPRRPPRSAHLRRRRLVTIGQVAGATAATSGILALLMFALAQRPDHPTTADGTTPVRTSAASGSRTASGSPRPPSPQVRSSAKTTTTPPVPPAPLTVIRRISATIHSYEQAGQIRADVGLDLDNLIQPVATDLIAGRPAPVAQLASTLRAKVATRLGENAMSRAAARALDAEITTLLGAERWVSRSSTPRR